ncbi:OmpA family protein [Lysobacter sp. K5869]|uniref:OmpA family protein n=1 Tax=Lysobacter sp. K5869 TaxID=2820808 RepID=UPI001C05EDAD|nr:OmpA family protein [Lysobacter sp. K5869]QWP77773.1 OmpA family protein [Lysobacter sp. K5869]
MISTNAIAHIECGATADRIVRAAASAVLLAFLTSCAASHVRYADVLYPEGPEFFSPQFRSGHPVAGERLYQSMMGPGLMRAHMRDNLRLIERLGSMPVKVVGSTDDIECAGAECIALSQRRAQVLIDWLVANGISRSRLRAVGNGPYMGSVIYAEGDRNISRRVEVWIDEEPVSKELPADRTQVFINADDFHGIHFESGEPRIDEPLLPASAPLPKLSEAALRHDLAMIPTVPADERLRVVGYTDTEECGGEACVRLSLRRAELMHRWLIDHGIPPARLNPPKGFGAARPIGDNASAEGRAKNRRAHIAYESETTD